MRRIHLANRLEFDRVAVRAGHRVRPGGELRARPLESMVGMAPAIRADAGIVDVVLPVRGGDDDRLRLGKREQRPLEGAEPIRIEMDVKLRMMKPRPLPVESAVPASREDG